MDFHFKTISYVVQIVTFSLRPFQWIHILIHVLARVKLVYLFIFPVWLLNWSKYHRLRFFDTG